MRLKGKTALITGAGSGIGEAAALLFAREGANVVVSDINEMAIESVASKIQSEGGSVLVQTADVTSEANCRAAVEATVKRFGRLDVLVTNPWWHPFKPLADTSTEEWERTLAVTLNGVFYCCKYALQVMVGQKSGSIINVSSVQGFSGIYRSASYMAAKGGVVQLTRSIAIDYGHLGIRANVISPGIIATPPTVESLKTEEDRRKANDQPLLKRMGTAEEVAWGALYLAADESSYVTGVNLVIDGGLTAHHSMQ